MSHKFVHIELSTRDQKESGAFYSKVFGWALQEFPDMNYTTFTPGEGEVGGGFNPISDNQPAGTVMAYIHTDDLADTLEKVKANGGEVLLESYDIPGVGTMATFKDPSGNTLSLLQPAEDM